MDCGLQLWSADIVSEAAMCSQILFGHILFNCLLYIYIYFFYNIYMRDVSCEITMMIVHHLCKCLPV